MMDDDEVEEDQEFVDEFEKFVVDEDEEDEGEDEEVAHFGF
jgi:hypothetical protein